jgi:hypothetical protein
MDISRQIRRAQERAKQTVRLDRGFFREHMIESFAGDCLFFEVVEKQYASLKRWIAAIPDKDFRVRINHSL